VRLILFTFQYANVKLIPKNAKLLMNSFFDHCSSIKNITQTGVIIYTSVNANVHFVMLGIIKSRRVYKVDTVTWCQHCRVPDRVSVRLYCLKLSFHYCDKREKKIEPLSSSFARIWCRRAKATVFEQSFFFLMSLILALFCNQFCFLLITTKMLKNKSVYSN